MQVWCGMTDLRPYQSRAVKALTAALRSSPSVLAVSPTGSGKTVIGVAVARRFRRVLWLAHRHELLAQTATEAGVGLSVSTLRSQKLAG